MQRTKLVDNQWVTFIEDKFQLPNGAECTYYHAQKSAAVMTIAIDGDLRNGHTFIVNQRRHPIETSIWQFPMGGFDANSENALDVAQKELKEETGVVAGEIFLMGSFYADPGFTNQKIYVCVTQDILSTGEQKLDSLEYGLECKKVPVQSIEGLIDSGEMGDAWGLAGHYYLQKYLLNNL